MKSLAKYNIGLRVKTARMRRALTQEQLAAAVGKTTATIANIENARSVPNLYTLERLSQALGVRLCDFFDEAGEKGTDRKRLELELRLRGMTEDLDDDDLEIVARQVATLLSFRNEQKRG